MGAAAVRQAMDRYFSVLGTDRFAEAVHPDVSWTVEDPRLVVTGSADVARHLDALHAAMEDTTTRELVVADRTACLEGDCADPDGSGARIPFCVVYEVRGGLVSAMRSYGRIEGALAAAAAAASGAERPSAPNGRR